MRYVNHGNFNSTTELRDCALEVPHECDDPKCPGNINRQKLEMFDEMYDAMGWMRKAMQIAGSELTCNKIDSILTRASALQEVLK